MPPTRLCQILFALTLILFSPQAAAIEEVLLWEQGAPGTKADRPEACEDRRETGRQDRFISHVSKPSLTFYPAANATANAPVVLVLPGGGFRYVVIDKEGHEVARWLNTQSISAAVLKYRTTPPDAEPSWSLYLDLLALGDAGRAIRLLRHHADKWKIDPRRIGLLGFSAGGTMAIHHTLVADNGKPDAADPIERHSSMPNSIGLIYTSLPDQKSPKLLPGVPFFIAHGAADKKIPVAVATKLFNTINGKGGSAELHVFQDADHGFGVAPATGTARSWPSLYVDWLRANQAK